LIKGDNWIILQTRMESFTITLDMKEKECDVSGSIVGLEFIYQQLNIAEKFIQFCSGKLKYLKF